MKLYNTLTRTVEILKPIGEDISLYTCGPTVYNYLHVGNWMAYVRWDVLYRTLLFSGKKVNWIMNITDVGHLVSDADEGEDKLEKGARREGKTAWEIAKIYTDDFTKGLDKLNISIPRDHLVKATDYITEQIELIKILDAKGFTYVIDDGVYFDTSKLKDYGKLARLKIDELKAGARVALNQQKKQHTDFALWKFSPKDHKRDMEWDSPWGVGFPGWHLECSALAMKFLGNTIDIHAGGIDHIPVHHTNEIAQSEAATGKNFVNLWIHSNFLTVDNTKISKSLDNGYTLQDLVEKGFTPLDFRLFILQSNYRTEANFSWEALNAAKNRLKNFQSSADLRWQASDSHPAWLKDTSIVKNITDCLSNDLNSPQALSLLSEFFALADNNLINSSELKLYNDVLNDLDDLLGLDLTKSKDISATAKDLLSKREAARSSKDWEKSDSLRDQLAKDGIDVRDTNYGQVWSRL